MKRTNPANLATLSFAALLAATAAHAGGFTAADIQYLYGVDNGSFEMNKGEAFPMWTLEVANGWTYGDNFFFTDINYGPSYDTASGAAIATYSELHSRLSFGKITGQTIALGPISDILLAGELDMPSGWFNTYCYGLGIDLKIPGFGFAFVNLFVRDEIKTKGVSFQINPVWMVPITLGPVKGVFGGWIDIMTGEGDGGEMWWQTQPTLLLDVANFWGAPGKLLVGCEYEYFYHFLGTKKTVNHPQFVIQWNL